MKILLVNPLENQSKRTPVYPSMGLLLIGTLLKRHGHDVLLRHFFPGTFVEPQFAELLNRFRPEMVGITMNTFQVSWGRIISECVKDTLPGVPIVAGGPHPTTLKTDFFNYFEAVDYIVVGDGEFPMLELASGKAPAGIAGIATRESWNSQPLRKDLDYIPPPDLGIMEDINLFSTAPPPGPLPSMCTAGSRGCPFRCNFCSESVVAKVVRYRSPENILKELDYLAGEGIRDILFTDDTFNLNKKWAMSVLQAIIDSGLNKRLSFRVSFRANKKLADSEILKKAREAGVWIVFYGVESGNQQMLRHIGKKLTVEEIVRAFDLTHKEKLKTVAAFMFGNVGDSVETMRDSLRFVRRLRAFHVGFSMAVPLPGTEFMEEIIRKGHLLETDYEKYDTMNCIVRTDSLTREQIMKLYSRATLYVALMQMFFGPNRIGGFKEFIRRLKRKINSVLR
ncbi:MAG: radical SAM protein [bacterium]